MEKRVIILGTTDLLKELLAEALQQRLGVACSIARNLQDSLEIGAQPITRIVLVDASDPSVDGFLTDIRLATSLNHTAFIVALYNVMAGGSAEREGLLRSIRGFFYRTDTIDLFCRGIRALFSGEIWVTRDVLTKIALEQAGGARPAPGPDIHGAGLTRREMEILACVAVGRTNDEIASRLSVSSHTVKTHLYRIYKKIHVGSRLQAALWAANKL